MGVPEWLISGPRARAHLHRDGTEGRTGTWPAWVPEPVLTALDEIGAGEPWQHQQLAAASLHAGHPTILTTPTASGKSLGYLVPILAATWGGDQTSPPDADAAAAPLPFEEGTRPRFRWSARPHTSLYLAPTKALAHDQWALCRRLTEHGLPQWRTIAVDGDSPTDDRVWAREHAAHVLTNPDWVHAALLPNHARWSGFLSSLRYVVIDEAHQYRGGFGAHIGMVLRRLLRLARLHGAAPVVALASATIGDAARHAADLTGLEARDVTVVSESTAPTGPLDVVLWQSGDHPDVESAAMMSRLVREGRQTATFVSSRNGAERVAGSAADHSGRRIESYRGGHLDLDRREIERGLREGTIRGVAATSALELGVDITGLDAVLCAGHPGSLSSLWQRFGRAGRRGTDALAVLVGADDPLDTWLLDHPEQVWGRRFEPVPVGLANRSIVAAHLAAAAQESPLREDDLPGFGPDARLLLEELVTAGVLRERPTGWYWTRPDRAVDAISLRAIGLGGVEVTDRATGQILATVDAAAADRTVHPGAIHLVRGTPWLVVEHEPDDRTAWVEPAPPGVRTTARQVGSIDIRETESTTESGVGRSGLGTVRVTSQVVECLAFDEYSGDLIDRFDLDRPVRELVTDGLWWELPSATAAHFGTGAAFGAALHALEHVIQALLPVFISCDRSEVAAAAQAADSRLVVHDLIPGGGGFVRLLAPHATDLMAAASRLVLNCPCEVGCPRCVVSARCPDHNDALDKNGAAMLAQLLGPA